MKKICFFIAVCFCLLTLAKLPEMDDFSSWSNEKKLPENWNLFSRNDRLNSVRKTEKGILLNGMIISEKFKIPGNAKEVKITLKTGSVKKFLKVYLFQCHDKTTSHFQQCGQAYDLKASDGNTYVTTLRVGMQSQRFAAFALDGDGAEIKSISLEPVQKVVIKPIQNEIPVIYNARVPRMDGKYHPEDWQMHLSLKIQSVLFPRKSISLMGKLFL